VKRYIPRRIKERNRWLRSDGKPNFKTTLRKHLMKLEPLMIKELPLLTPTSILLEACEFMSKHRLRVLPVTSPNNVLKGIVFGMDVIHLLAGDKRDVIRSHNITSLYEFIKLPVRKFMNDNPIVIDANTEVYNVIETMVLNNVGALPVVNKDGTFKGIISESSLVKYLARKITGVKVKEIMTKEVITSNIKRNLAQVMETMCVSGIRRVPIVDDKERIVGVITWKTIIDLIGKHKVFSLLPRMRLEELLTMPISNLELDKPLAVTEDEDIGEVVFKMLELSEDYALVIEGEALKGIITERDILYGLLMR